MRYLIVVLVAVGLSPQIYGQEQLSPFEAGSPRIFRTAFTNWDRIDLIYTLRWADGYEPIYEDIKPDNMNFSPLELDEGFETGKPELSNRREYTREFKEHYVDVTYHLRYAGEKKGEITISPQIFRYRKIQAGKADFETLSFKTEKFTLKYDTTLTPDASDIKDMINFGSFSGLALLWHGGAVGTFLVLSLLAAFLIFRRPLLVVDISDPKKKSAGPRNMPVDHLRELKKASQKLAKICSGKDLKSGDFYEGVVNLNSALRSVLQLYVPGVTWASTSPEIERSISAISFPWLKYRLMELKSVMDDCQNYLYKADRSGNKDPGELRLMVVAHLMYALRDSGQLKPANIAWQRRLSKFRNSRFVRLVKGLRSSLKRRH